MLWKILFIAGTLLGAGAGFGGGLYAADYEVVATIVDKQCAGPVPPGFNGAGPDAQDPSTNNGANPSQQPSAPESTDPSAPSAGANSTVTVRPRVLGVPFEVEVADFPNDKCWPLRSGEDGNFVTVNIRTERAVFYEREGGSCIFHTVFGPGCVLPELAQDIAMTAATARFMLSTSGYSDPAPPVPLLPPAPNCVTVPADEATEVTINATWQSGATDGTLRLVVEALADGTAVSSASQTGGSPLSVTVELGGADAYRIAVYPEGEVLGSTASIAIDVQAFGIEAIPDASPEPCN